MCLLPNLILNAYDFLLPLPLKHKSKPNTIYHFAQKFGISTRKSKKYPLIAKILRNRIIFYEEKSLVISIDNLLELKSPTNLPSSISFDESKTLSTSC